MKQKTTGFRIMMALIFIGLCALLMLSIYLLSAEDGFTSTMRSAQVTEILREQVREHLESTGEGLALSQRIRDWIILHSPYGSDWYMNVRKLAHFGIYFALALMCMITLAILGVKKFGRVMITLGICILFAVFDELHQGDVAGRIMSDSDVIIDTAGALCAVILGTFISVIYSLIRLPFKQHEQNLS